MIIVGAGLTGLLAGHYFRRHNPEILEASPGPVTNHTALLRFRSDAVTRLTGADTLRVSVRKAVTSHDGSQLLDRCSLTAANLYARKVTGIVSDRSIIDLSPVTRYVPGPRFMDQVRHGLNIKYGYQYAVGDSYVRSDNAVISTIPMQYWLGEKIPHENIVFSFRPITVISATIRDVDINQTVYFPYDIPIYRASFVGSRLIIEMMGNHDSYADASWEYMIAYVCKVILGSSDFDISGIVASTQKIGKIIPLQRDLRRDIVGRITQTFGVYSIGRYATWRQLTTDDVISDLSVLESLISNDPYWSRTHYARKKS